MSMMTKALKTPGMALMSAWVRVRVRVRVRVEDSGDGVDECHDEP